MSNSDQAELLERGDNSFGVRDPIIVSCIALILVGLISVIDKVTGYDLNLTVLHLAPITMMTWAAGRAWGMLLSVLAVTVWVTMFRNSHHYVGNLYHYWNGVTLLITFMTVAVLVGRLRDFMRHEGNRFAEALECIEGAAYVADIAKSKVLFGNRRFREQFAEWPFARLEQAYPSTQVKARNISWPDGRPVVLRVLPAA